jgi:ethanolamine utilization protein EutQ (cupin superfamily)
MSAGENKVNIWGLTGMNFFPVGPDGGDPMQSMPVDVDGWKAGYLDFLDTVFEWTQETDELVFVIEGTMTLTYEGTDFVSGPGDVVLIHEGTHLTFAGTKDCRIAYANGYSAGGPDAPVTVWHLDEAISGAAANSSNGAPIDRRIFDLAKSEAGYLDLEGGAVSRPTEQDEFLWVTAGRVEVALADSTHSLGVGDFAYIRPGVQLGLEGTKDARVAYFRATKS